MIIYVQHRFCAAHRLPGYPGDCGRLHGHTWRVEVWVEGEPGEEGMVVDFREIKRQINLLDHGVLNDTIPVPTAENVASYLFEQIPGCVRLRVWESDDCYAEV